MDNRTERINVPVTLGEKDEWIELARRNTEGNVAFLVRLAMREYAIRHMTEQPVTTEYELSQNGTSYVES